MPSLLQRVSVQGFASLREITLHPGPMSVLIGPNGSGKSNLLRVLKLLPLLRTQSLQRFVGEAGGASGLLHDGPRRTPVLTLEAEFTDGAQRFVYHVELAHAAGDRLLYTNEELRYQAAEDQEELAFSLGGGHWESALREYSPGDPLASFVARQMNRLIGGMSFFHVHDTSISSALRAHARAVDDRSLRSDGSNLASYLCALKASEQEEEQIAWRRINALVSRIAPVVKELCPVRVSDRAVRLDWLDDRDEVFGVHQLSDGTLRAIALLTALAQPTSRLPAFISIDEPELGLHPAAIRLLIEQARAVAAHTQVLFATQSETVLDYFEPEEVVVIEREQGHTVLKTFTPEALEGWLEDYTLSEVFDKGLLGGQP